LFGASDLLYEVKPTRRSKGPLIRVLKLRQWGALRCLQDALYARKTWSFGASLGTDALKPELGEYMGKKSQATAAVFADYQKSRTGHMRYTLAQKNILLLHALDRPLRILDAAGGNGLNTQWLARQGHSVTLLDADPLMLKQAEQRLAEENLLDRCQFVNGAIERAAELLPHEQFDLVLCHHIIEYLTDPCHLFRELHKVCTAAG
jgi:2-polyprenyl-3-methyl-5-hydroxy-6-metoxy-1,4-benzoquinol methylase